MSFIAEQLGDPSVLWNCSEALIQYKLQTPVIGMNSEWTPPQVRTPMSDNLDQTDELMLICRQRGMMGGDRPAEEGHHNIPLMEDNTEPCTQHIAVDAEALGEVRKLEQGRRHQRLFEGQECPPSASGVQENALRFKSAVKGSTTPP